MATDDIYRCSINCSTNNRAWSFGFWVREMDPLSAGGDGLTVAEAVENHLNEGLRDILSGESVVESYDAAKRWPGHNPAGRAYVASGTGYRPTDALSNDNALYLSIRQTYTDSSHNGGMFIAGQAQIDQSASKWDDGYMTGRVKDFQDLLMGNFDAISPATGRWTLGVFSKKVLPWTITGFGTFMDATGVQATARVMTQSRRRQKRKGFK